MRPKDYPVTCDISGLRVPRSKAKLTWDGLLVHPLFWSPKHPQLEIRPVLERPVPGEVRPPQEKFVGPDYGFGTLCLRSPGGKTFVVSVEDDGALVVREGLWGRPHDFFCLGGYALSVDDDGALLVSQPAARVDALSWRICSVGGRCFNLTIDPDRALKLQEV